MPDSVAGPSRDRNASSVELAAIVLAAGAGKRLQPLTSLRPKALCPVGGVPLVDLALRRVEAVTPAIAVTAHHGAGQLAAHLARADRPPRLSLEQPEALGTAGALGALRGWIDGRPVLVHNADAWTTARLEVAVAAWDGERPAVVIDAPEFSPGVGLVATLLPWSSVAGLEAVPSGLYGAVLAPASSTGRLQVLPVGATFVDCGTPGDYLRANLEAARLAGGRIVDPTAQVYGVVERAVVGAQAVVEGVVRDSVLWDDARVGPDEALSGVIRAPGLPDVQPTPR
jgi:NDP-sugar pyrophosphorylase family protein